MIAEALGFLTSLPRTARKQPLLSSEGSNTKKGSVSSGCSAWSGFLNGDGLRLEEIHKAVKMI